MPAGMPPCLLPVSALNRTGCEGERRRVKVERRPDHGRLANALKTSAAYEYVGMLVDAVLKKKRLRFWVVVLVCFYLAVFLLMKLACN
jgi:hypothetical protein